MNIWHGNLIESVIRFIKSEKPDIISLQEVYSSNNSESPLRYQTYQYLQKALYFPYSSYAPAYGIKGDKNEAQEGNAVLSKYPILHTKVSFYDIPYKTIDEDDSTIYAYYPRNLQLVSIVINGKELFVCNTHGIWGFDGLDNERRLKMSATIVKNIKNKKPLILSGDFNLLEKTKTIEHIEKYVQNVFKDQLKSTFNMKHKTDQGYATAVVDMIFISPNVKIIKQYKPEVDVSDHNPLVIVAEI